MCRVAFLCCVPLFLTQKVQEFTSEIDTADCNTQNSQMLEESYRVTEFYVMTTAPKILHDVEVVSFKPDFLRK